MITVTKKRLSKFNMDDHFKVCTSMDIPFKNSFDIVFFIGLLGNIQDKDLYLKKASNIVKKNGSIIVSFTNNRSLYVYRAILKLLLRFRFNKHLYWTIRYLLQTGVWETNPPYSKKKQERTTSQGIGKLLSKYGFKKSDEFYVCDVHFLDKDPLNRNRMLCN